MTRRDIVVLRIARRNMGPSDRSTSSVGAAAVLQPVVSAADSPPVPVEAPVPLDDAPAGPRRSLIGRLFAASGLWALIDQGVCSAGNFLTGVLMARTLEKQDFGFYSLLLGVLMFLGSLHGSIVTYPLTLNGAGAPVRRFRQILLRGIGFTAAITPVLSIVVIAAAARVGDYAIVPWVVAAMLFRQTQETARRALQARLRHRASILGDAICFLGQAGCIWLLIRQQMLATDRAFMIIAATSALATAVQLVQLLFTGAAELDLAPGETPPEEGPPVSLAAEARDWWKIGRWLLVTCLVNVGTIYLPPWVLEAFRGQEEVASMYALWALLNLTNPVLFSLSGLVVAASASARARAATPMQGLSAARAVAIRYTLLGLALVVPYYLLVSFFPGIVLRLFYGANSPYLSLAPLAPLVVVMYAMLYLSQMGLSLLNGLGEARGSFIATLTSSVAMVAISVPLTWKFGLYGSLIGGTIPFVGQLVVTLLMIRRLERSVAGGQGSAT
jgi:O-antigen/teichoic acid export membrane protein